MARVSPGEGDIQAQRLSDIDWLEASRTQHEARRGCPSADLGHECCWHTTQSCWQDSVTNSKTTKLEFSQTLYTNFDVYFVALKVFLRTKARDKSRLRKVNSNFREKLLGFVVFEMDIVSKIWMSKKYNLNHKSMNHISFLMLPQKSFNFIVRYLIE